MFFFFGLSPDPDENGEIKITWEQMKSSLEANNETFAWMDKVEEDILDASTKETCAVPSLHFEHMTDSFIGPCCRDKS